MIVVCGVWPAGMSSGDSWILICCDRRSINEQMSSPQRRRVPNHHLAYRELRCHWLFSNLPLNPTPSLTICLSEKGGAVVDERQAVGGVAVPTHSRLRDAPAVHLHAGAVGAHLALEERLLHLGDELRGADHHAADGDELIDVCGGKAYGDTEALVGSRYLTFYGNKGESSQISHTKYGMNVVPWYVWSTLTCAHTFWVQAPHVPGLQSVVGANLDLVFQNGVWETLKEKFVDGHVEGWEWLPAGGNKWLGY